MTKFYFLLACILNLPGVYASSPNLIWHQTYGISTDNQKVSVMAVDNYDNMFAAGYVNFGTNGNILVNEYDGLGHIKWNRIYNNTYPSGKPDQPVALFPDNQAGVTVVAYINTQAVLTHILRYDASGYLQADHVIGDTSTGKKTMPLAVLYDGVNSFYMIGQLNSVSKIFKCDNNGNILWSAPLHNAFNNQVGSIAFDPSGNIIAGVSDSLSLQVAIHVYDAHSGNELPGFNTGIDSLPVNDNFIKIQVDQSNNIFIAALGSDSLGRTQLVVDKFDASGTLAWTTICNATKGHSNTVNSFLLDHNGDVLISGPYTDNADTLQYAAVYKIANTTGDVLWSAIDSQFLVNSSVTKVDQFNNVYLGTTKTPSNISSDYSNFSFSQLTPDSGAVQWRRSFDNSADNFGLIMQVNNFGDLFFVTNSPKDSSNVWFLGRVGNAANDSVGTDVKTVADNITLNTFPNPFSSVTNISFTALQQQEVYIKLYDITGQLILQQETQCRAGYNQLQLNTSSPPGIYLLQLVGANSFSSQQVVIY